MFYWLIVFYLSAKGDYLYREELRIPSKVECQNIRAKLRAPVGKRIESYCVSDDHFRGLKQDPGVPLD